MPSPEFTPHTQLLSRDKYRHAVRAGGTPARASGPPQSARGAPVLARPLTSGQSLCLTPAGHRHLARERDTRERRLTLTLDPVPADSWYAPHGSLRHGSSTRADLPASAVAG